MSRIITQVYTRCCKRVMCYLRITILRNIKLKYLFLYLFGDFDRLIGDEASQLLNISEVMEPRFARLIVNDPVRCWSRARITRSTRSWGAFSHSHRSTSSASKSMARPITPKDLCLSSSSNPCKKYTHGR